MPADTELHRCANQGDEGELADLLSSGALAVDTPGAQGRTPLHRALGSGHVRVVEMLLERKADVTIRDACHRNGLHWLALGAETGPAFECLRMLLDHDASALTPMVNEQSESKSTPLHCAVLRGHTAVAKLLVEIGADLSLADEDGKKPADLAKAGGNKDLIKLLKK